jgi:hypothetical protein
LVILAGAVVAITALIVGLFWALESPPLTTGTAGVATRQQPREASGDPAAGLRGFAREVSGAGVHVSTGELMERWVSW